MRVRVVVAALLLALMPVTAFAQSSPFPFVRAVVFQAAATANGNGTSIDTSEMQVLGVQVVLPSTGTATVNPEGKIGGTTWNAISCYPQGSSTASAAPAIGLFRCNTLGIPEVRMRLSGYSGTGSVNVYGFATSAGPLPVDVP